MRVLVLWNDLNATDLKRIENATQATILQGRSKEENLELAPQANVMFGFASSKVLEAATNCQWYQAAYAGAETILKAKWGNPQMHYTNGRGIFGPCIGEHVLGFMLSLNRGLHLARDNQLKKEWQPDLPIPFRELTDSTVGILGYGDLGSEVAKRLQGFSCEIIGFRQHPQGNEPYAHAVYGIDRFDEFLPKLDYLVCCLPHTEKTIGFLDKKRMQQLPKHAMIINVGRGSLIPTDDLVFVLQEEKIAGAALDVTEVEPLPNDSPLWEMSNVIITPHNSGRTVFHKKRAIDLFLANWDKFIETGQPELNVINRELGY